MADDRFISPQHPLSLFPPGTLNSWGKPEFDKETSRFKGLGGVATANGTDLIRQHFKDEIMSDDVSHMLAQELIGLCFRVDQGGAKSGSKIKPHNWVDKILKGGALDLPKGPVVQIKVWIPELWFGVVPEKMGDIAKGPHHKHIDRLPTFYYLKKDLPIPKPGQLVQVKFNDPKNLSLGGKYLGLLSEEPGIPSIKSLGSPKDALEKKCKNLGPAGPSGPPIIGNNLEVGSVGRLLPVDWSTKSQQHVQAFGNKASCRGTSRRWSAALETQGLHIGGFSHYEKYRGNGEFEGEHREATGRETIIYFPRYGVDFYQMPPEIMFFFHDSGGFIDVDFKRIAKAMKTLNDQNRNYVFVVTELPWSHGISPTQRAKTTNDPQAAFSGQTGGEGNELLPFQLDPGDWSIYEKEVMAVIEKYAFTWATSTQAPGPKPSLKVKKTFIAVGSGGIAVKNAITTTGAKPDKIVMANADHLTYKNLALIANYVDNNATSLLTITRGISNTPLSIHSVNALKKKGIKPKSIGSLALSPNKKYGLIGFTSNELVVQNAIAYKGFKNSLVENFPQTIDGSDSMTDPAPDAKPDVPATLGQGKNVDPVPTPTGPPLPEGVQDLMDQKAAQENLIKAAEAEIQLKLKEGSYAEIEKIKNNQINNAKNKISELTKQINEKTKAFEPKKKTAANIDPACPDANAINTVADMGSGATQKNKNKKPWKSVGYKFSSEGILII